MNHAQSELGDRGHLLTERRLDDARELDTLSVEKTLRLINAQDAQVAPVVQQAITAIALLVETIIGNMRLGGRLLYVGAGTSGRLGVLDASECPPTFHTESDLVVGLIAGGDTALRRSSEGAEDDFEGAAVQLDREDVGKHDTVVGIAAGGTTPYVLGALRIARGCGATTALICCANNSQPDGDPGTDDSAEPQGSGPHRSDCDHLVFLPVGPEVVTGSTRMKAGTATKMVLNMITTATFVQCGKVWGNLMVDLRATNDKLRDRAGRILMQQCPDRFSSRAQALDLLEQAGGQVKVALVMARRHVDACAAKRLINEHDGKLKSILGPPR